MGKLPDIKNVNLKGKRVFVRADLDVPLSEFRVIEDETRLVAGMPTIQYLLEKGARVIVGGHLGRPRGFDKNLSLEPVAKWFSIKYKVLSIKYKKLEDFDGWEIGENLFLLENLRFYEGEEKNDPEFAQKLAKLADIYVNDAFAMCHRNHASIVGVPSLLSHYAGLRLQKEVEELSNILEKPKRPLVVIIGGQKIETKLPLIEKMEKFADFVLVGGKIAQEAKKVKANLNKKVIVADSNQEGTDITEESLNQFLSVIKNAKTIVWNGPLGRIGAQKVDSERGTKELAKAIAQSSAYKVIGGGDTTEFVKRIGLFDKFDFVSTGGGAMLTFLSGEKLPGLEALIN